MIDYLLAQMPEASWTNALFAYGPMGVMLGWFMVRGERKMDSVVTELRVLGHRINGMTRAMLADVAARETTGAALKTLVNSELVKLADEDDVRSLRSRGKK